MAHMHYKGTGKVHSFRGLLASGGQRKIRIQGPVGAIAWRITKLLTMSNTPGIGGGIENTTKVYREEQSSVDAVVNFDDAELLGAAYISEQDTASYPPGVVIVFDNALFSRNIWVTSYATDGAHKINYYIELEEVKVSAAGMAQLAVAAARRTK
jgi:hypothetical protein